MNKKLITKIFTISAIILLFCGIFTYGVEATSASDFGVSDLTEKANDTTGSSNSFKKVIQSIVTITQVIAVGVAVIMLIVISIKYMLASPGEKATIKK